MNDHQAKIEIGLSTYSARISTALIKAKEWLEFSDVFIVHQLPGALNDEDTANLKYLLGTGRFRYLTMSEAGVAKSRNKAIRETKGEYLWFLDDDVDINREGYDALSSLLEARRFDVLTVAVLDDMGIRHRHFPSQSVRRNRFSILSVGTIEVIINVARVRLAGCQFPEDMGAGTQLPIGDEPVFLARCLKAGLKIFFTPLYIVAHPRISSGTDFLADANCRARGLAFRRIYGRLLGLGVLFLMYTKKAMTKQHPINKLWRGYCVSVSTLIKHQ